MRRKLLQALFGTVFSLAPIVVDESYLRAFEPEDDLVIVIDEAELSETEQMMFFIHASKSDTEDEGANSSADF